MWLLPTNHVTAQFPTDCASCHNENAWMPAFDHDGLYFYLQWQSQRTMDAMCRMPQQSINYAPVQLSGCHQNRTNNQHRGVGGMHTVMPCLACHPGRSYGTTFNHNATAFPLTGGHIGVDCIQCHANGYQGTTTVC